MNLRFTQRRWKWNALVPWFCLNRVAGTKQSPSRQDQTSVFSEQDIQSGRWRHPLRDRIDLADLCVPDRFAA